MASWCLLTGSTSFPHSSPPVFVCAGGSTGNQVILGDVTIPLTCVVAFQVGIVDKGERTTSINAGTIFLPPVLKDQGFFRTRIVF